MFCFYLSETPTMAEVDIGYNLNAQMHTISGLNQSYAFLF